MTIRERVSEIEREIKALQAEEMPIISEYDIIERHFAAGEQELLAALGTFIDHVEEIDLMLAEVLLRTHSSEMRMLGEDFESESPITYLEALHAYEKLCRAARVKWNLPGSEGGCERQ